MFHKNISMTYCNLSADHAFFWGPPFTGELTGLGMLFKLLEFGTFGGSRRSSIRLFRMLPLAVRLAE